MEGTKRRNRIKLSILYHQITKNRSTQIPTSSTPPLTKSLPETCSETNPTRLLSHQIVHQQVTSCTTLEYSEKNHLKPETIYHRWKPHLHPAASSKGKKKNRREPSKRGAPNSPPPETQTPIYFRARTYHTNRRAARTARRIPEFREPTHCLREGKEEQGWGAL